MVEDGLRRKFCGVLEKYYGAAVKEVVENIGDQKVEDWEVSMFHLAVKQLLPVVELMEKLKCPVGGGKE